MRIAICALSAVLLSGCSWLGNMGQGFGHQKHQQAGQYGAKVNPCQVPHARAPLPRGCHPSQVTIGNGFAQQGNMGQPQQQNHFANGFSQKPQFGNAHNNAPQNVTGGYGSHAAQAGAHQGKVAKGLRKPKLRGSLSLGVEKSVGGDYLDFATAGLLDPSNGYNPGLTGPFDESTLSGSIASGQTVQRQYYADIEEILRPNISFDDVHSTPLKLSGGLEYIVNPKTTLFANAGYSYSEGNSGSVATVIGTLQRDTTVRDYDPDTFALVSTSGFGTFIPNQEIATFDYNFSDMERIDLEVGGRRYFEPILKGTLARSLTPFVGASVGASHHNSQTFTTRQTQVFFERAFEAGGVDNVTNQDPNYIVDNGNVITELYGSQWVPSGQLNAGVEWQMSPRTALAFETGVRIEGAREYANGQKGDSNIAIPLTVRGSFNF